MMAFIGLLGAGGAVAQINGAGERPFMGWTTWSMQDKFGNYPATAYTGEAAGDGFQNEWNVRANSDAMKSSGLQAHGFSFINIDGDWDNGLLCQCGAPTTWDTYGRPQSPTSPDFLPGWPALLPTFTTTDNGRESTGRAGCPPKYGPPILRF